jgi:hypothetical protein
VSRWRRIAVLASLLAAAAFGAEEPRLRLKNRRVAVEAEGAELRVPPAKSRIGGRAHIVVEFRGEPDRRALRELEARGARVLAYVPDAGFLVSASEDVQLDGLGLRWVGRLEAPDKLSPRLEPGEQWQCVVQFHPDVEREEAEALVREHLLEILPHPDLRRNELLVAGAPSRVQRLAEWDEVAYIYPASAELVSGEPVHACPGALTEWGPVGEYVAQIGDGWDGPGRNAAELHYYYAALARRLPRESVAAEITRALEEWARFVVIRFLPGADEWGPKTLRFYFGAGAHECPYPFNGPGRTLAHAFYPSPPNPEPIAGDVHFDDDEAVGNWRLSGCVQRGTPRDRARAGPGSLGQTGIRDVPLLSQVRRVDRGRHRSDSATVRRSRGASHESAAADEPADSSCQSAASGESAFKPAANAACQPAATGIAFAQSTAAAESLAAPSRCARYRSAVVDDHVSGPLQRAGVRVLDHAARHGKRQRGRGGGDVVVLERACGHSARDDAVDGRADSALPRLEHGHRARTRRGGEHELALGGGDAALNFSVSGVRERGGSGHHLPVAG